MFSLSSTQTADGESFVSTKLYWSDPSTDITSIDDFSKTYTASFGYKFPDGSTKIIETKEVFAIEPVGYFKVHEDLDQVVFRWMDTAGAMTNLLIIIQTVNIV